MKLSIRSMISAIALSAVVAGTANAAAPTNKSVSDDLRKALGHGQIQVTVRDGVVTLFGDVQDSIERYKALRAAENSEGVSHVNNLITSN